MNNAPAKPDALAAIRRRLAARDDQFVAHAADDIHTLLAMVELLQKSLEHAQEMWADSRFHRGR